MSARAVEQGSGPGRWLTTLALRRLSLHALGGVAVGYLFACSSPRSDAGGAPTSTAVVASPLPPLRIPTSEPAPAETTVPPVYVDYLCCCDGTRSNHCLTPHKHCCAK